MIACDFARVEDRQLTHRPKHRNVVEAAVEAGQRLLAAMTAYYAVAAALKLVEVSGSRLVNGAWLRARQ